MTPGQAGSGGGAAMRDTDLFGLALGVEPPWVVRKSAFDGAAKRLDIYLDFARGSRFACPQCGAAGCPAYDSDEKTWRHRNFFQHEAYLHARVPRVRCTGCGIKQVAVPWARVDSGFTLLFEALVMAMVQAMPVAVVARMVEEWDTRLWRVIHHYVEAALDRVDHSEVTSAAVDETAARRGHNYVSLFVDLARRRVLFVAEGKDADTVEAFAQDLTAHGGDPQAIAEVCIDMSPAFIAGVTQSLPNAQITFDKFHVVRLINDAVDVVRRRCEPQDQPGLPHPPGLPGALSPTRQKRRGVSQKMVLVGHPQPAAADDPSSAHGQTPLERHSPLVPQPDCQWHHRSHQQSRPSRQSQSPWLPLNPQPEGDRLSHRRQARTRFTHLSQRRA